MGYRSRMRTLLLMRGAPGCGKSTWIDQHGLRPYALSADEIRLMIQSPSMNANGKLETSQTNDKQVWETLFQMLECRMQRGDFTVIDATNSKTQEMKRYKDFAKQYRYRIFCVDMTDLPMDVCIERNVQRPTHKQVPVSAIEKCYARFATQGVPSGITVIGPHELDKMLAFPAVDLSKYERVVLIGDVHGCMDAVESMMLDLNKESTYYIFTGDYIDRGPQSVEMCQFLHANKDNDNFCILEGNHERWVKDWADGKKALSDEFENVTRKQFDSSSFTKKMGRELYYRMRQCIRFTFCGQEFFVCHGGISNIPELGLVTLSTEQLIRGTGRYREVQAVDEAWTNNQPHITQIHAHRNIYDVPAQVSGNVWNLEGAVERGGALRVLVLDSEGAHSLSYHSKFVPPPKPKTSVDQVCDVAQMIEILRAAKNVDEKKFDHISSFNFTRDAFYDRDWNANTMKARGLFVNTELNTIAARSYEKFFNVGERPETEIESLVANLRFPVTAYLKYNGFLGIVGYDAKTDDLLIVSKSSVGGPYAENFKRILLNATHDKEKVLEYIRTNNKSLIFECIDPVNDPHIIEYGGEQVVLLDVVDNTTAFSKLSYAELANVGCELGYNVKEMAEEFDNAVDLVQWIEDVQGDEFVWNGEEVEGFVVEDATGFMFKVKSGFYKMWKKLRAVAHDVMKQGYIKKTSMLVNVVDNLFYGWIRAHREVEGLPQDIISLRKRFMEERQNEKQDCN